MKETNFFIQYRKQLLYLFYALLAYIVILILKELRTLDVLKYVFDLLMPLIYGFIIAWLLNPAVDFIENHGYKRIYATSVIFLLLLLSIYFLIYMFIPVVVNQLNDVVRLFDGWIEQLNEYYEKVVPKDIGMDLNLDRQQIQEVLMKWLMGTSKGVSNTVSGIFTFIINVVSLLGYIVLTLTITFYFLLDYRNVKGRIIKVVPKKYRSQFDCFLSDLNCDMNGYVRGIILVSFFLAMMATLGFWFIGLKGSIIFGIFIGITDIIPYFGPVLGGIPVVLAASIQGFNYAVIALATLLIVQFIESSILQPYVIGKTTEINPILIIMGLFIGGKLFGIVGMLFSTPIIIFILVVLKYLQKEKL